MTEYTKFEEAVAYAPLTGVCVPRQRLFTSRGWTYHLDSLDSITHDEEE